MRGAFTELFWPKEVLYIILYYYIIGKYNLSCTHEIPYYQVFILHRCFFGSDWPVCRMATDIVDYPETLKLLEDCVEEQPKDVKKAIFQDTVIEFYNLHDVVDL